MCLNPSFVWITRGPKSEKQPVPCKTCWQCKQSRLNDYVGRCLAEMATSEKTCVLTLTYANRSDLADKVLHPRHFQLFMKRLRRSGHLVRYLVAGEYGDLKGRTHFHVLLFFKRLMQSEGSDVAFYNPDHILEPELSRPFDDRIPQLRMSHIREWPHGHIFADWSADERSIKYVCKYLLSDQKNRVWLSMSKRPQLGAEWFAQKAEQARKLGVLPSTFDYLPPGATRSRPYVMTGATRRDYLNAIIQNPDGKPKMSEWVLKTFEKHERQRLIESLESLPLEVQEQAFNDRRERETEQYDQKREWDRLRYVDGMADKLAQSPDGILRRVAGKWVPNVGKEK